jgi:uncharacterized protein
MTGTSLRSCIRLPALCCCIAALFAPAAARSQVAEIPYLTGRITDNAEMLSTEIRAHLTEIVKIHEEATGNQIAILTMPSLEGVMLEEFAARVLQAWKLGSAGKENAVLLLVSPGDRRIRIEVGSGLKGKLSEVSATRIIRDLMTPPFQEGDYNRGIDAGIHAIIGQLDGNEQPQAVSHTETQAQDDSFFEGPDLPIYERILIGSFIFGIIGLFTIIGILTPGAGWFLYLFLIPFWAMFPIIVVGGRGAFVLLMLYLVCFPAAKLVLARVRWYQRAKADLRSKGVAQIGGFTVRSGSSAGSTWSSS